MDINDKRRKMADRLRHSVACVRPGDELCDQGVLAVLCVGPGHHEGYSDAEDVLRLADLIDRPTCHLARCHMGYGSCSWGIRCDRCGGKFNHVIPRQFIFCPKCGAEVVEDE